MFEIQITCRIKHYTVFHLKFYKERDNLIDNIQQKTESTLYELSFLPFAKFNGFEIKCPVAQ